ncbi:MAG: PH domain-containing protein [Lentisphaeria bacterium]|nr:PH domain-containing protein [Lentisphaeria bacterium]
MTTPSDGSVFKVRRAPVARYFYFGQILFILFVGVWFFGLGILLALLYALTLGHWLSRKQAEALRYWLDGGTLRVDQGVFFFKRKAIPLDRVTDVVLTQGPLMRWCGIWGLQVQTAGTGQGMPEAILYGLAEPERMRDQLLAARDKAVAERRRD